MLVWAWWLLFLIFNGLVAWFDFTARRVPNRLLIAGFAGQSIWLLSSAIKPVDTGFIIDAGVMIDTGFIYFSTSWIDSVTGLVAGLAVFYPLWRFRAMGAGDVKFIALLGFCLGLPGQISALLFASILAGIHALALVSRQGRAAALSDRYPTSSQATKSIPYAAYLALAALGSAVWYLYTQQSWLHTLWGG